MIYLKSISETISTLIIAGTVIIISITVFYFSLANLQQATLSSEYGYIRSVFLGLADSFPDILEGGSYGARLPSRMVGIGYINYSDTLIKVMILNGTDTLLEYSDTPLALYASAYASLVVRERTVYGRDDLVVDETLLLPFIREYYSNGATYLVFDTARFYVKIYEYESNNEHVYLINIIYVKITVKLLSTRLVQLTVLNGGDIINERLVGITNLQLMRTRNGVTEVVELADLIPNPGPNPVYIVNIVVKNIEMVIT